ncbi:type II secretion system F family protein [Kitasatospora sp. MAA4]|uniref:type II secretion system F family protein n=1 Tax=Kitasatospora sp. MAA4 TaxID=3035093 RepID=UPI00247529C7|nr:type II secretion system F family protein [Kitasatospora sp. MAA4]
MAITELCAALAGELRSGATPDQALDSIAGRGRSSGGLDSRLGEEAVVRLAAGRYGADVPAAFRWLAQLPGGGGAAAIAACWQVTADSGTGLATGLDRVAEALRAERALEDEIRGELAGPRTTAGLLAALPVFGLLLGGALGAHPVTILLHTPLGLGCLSAGAVLEAVGLVWTARIVRGAQYLAGAGAGAGEGEGGELGASREPACGAGRGGGVGDGAARSAHSSHARHARPSRCTARTWWTGRAGRVAAARAEVAW